MKQKNKFIANKLNLISASHNALNNLIKIQFYILFIFMGVFLFVIIPFINYRLFGVAGSWMSAAIIIIYLILLYIHSQHNSWGN
jgi:hypothetical protein